MTDAEKGEQKKDPAEEHLRSMSDEQLAGIAGDALGGITTRAEGRESHWGDKSIKEIGDMAQAEVERRKLANMK